MAEHNAFETVTEYTQWEEEHYDFKAFCSHMVRKKLLGATATTAWKSLQ